MKESKKIIQLCHFTIARPVHGGQKRVAAIHNAYRRAGFDPYFVGIYNDDDFPEGEVWPTDFKGPRRIEYTKGSMLLDDLNLGYFLAQNDAYYADLVRRMEAIEPDLLQIEHPWLWPVVERLKRESLHLRSVPFIYSSHNIEWRLKERILVQFGVQDPRGWSRKVQALEVEAAQAADLVLAVTEDDARELREMGARQVEVARNGMDSRVLPPQRRTSDEPFALFVGSGHPPNVRGFLDILGPHLAFLRPDQRIRVIGSVSHGIKGHPDYQLYAEFNDARIDFRGEASEDELSQSLADCSCIILPITESAGSNLKTAEALLSEKPIVATKTAMRGYERFFDEPLVKVASNAAEFRRCLQSLLLADQRILEAIPRPGEAKLKWLTWDICLENLGTWAAHLAKRTDVGARSRDSIQEAHICPILPNA